SQLTTSPHNHTPPPTRCTGAGKGSDWKCSPRTQLPTACRDTSTRSAMSWRVTRSGYDRVGGNPHDERILTAFTEAVTTSGPSAVTVARVRPLWDSTTTSR